METTKDFCMLNGFSKAFADWTADMKTIIAFTKLFILPQNVLFKLSI